MAVDGTEGVRPRGAIRVVLEGPPGSAAGEAARLQEAGFVLREGFRVLGPVTPRTVCHGVVASESDASAAVLAAMAGYGVLIETSAAPDTIRRLVDDLRHLGPVDHRLVSAAAPPAVLDFEGRALLGLLAKGFTLGAAARQLGLPRRTADRRLAGARKALGVERTAEAIAKASRLGWLG